MGTIRQDAWTPDDDLLLAEVTLRYIREGGTQLAAFEEVALKLGRTAAACGFRWNSTVRKDYLGAIALAREERERRKQAKLLIKKEKTSDQTLHAPIASEVEPQKNASEQITLDQINYDHLIRYLKEQKELEEISQKKINRLERELREKEKEIAYLKEENSKMIAEYKNAMLLKEDYRTLIDIMERARKQVIMKEEGEKPIFKMDLNGNLERVYK